MYDRLRNFNINAIEIDEAIAMLAFAKTIRAEYDNLQVDVPIWLDERVREIKHEIRARHQDIIDKRLREVNAKLDSLKTPEEKRTDLRAEKDRLEKAKTSVA